MKKKILVLNGPNLNMLGIREPNIYGSATYSDLVEYIRTKCVDIADIDFKQTNHEGVLIDLIQQSINEYDGIVLNAGGYTHTSVALADAVKAVPVPCVEVHISDISKRESFRNQSYLTPVCRAVIMGKGFDGYVEAVNILTGEN